MILTRGLYYGNPITGISVIRGCDPATGRDRVLLQNYSDISYVSDLYFVGLDRTWAVFWQSVTDRDGAGPATVTVVNALTGTIALRVPAQRLGT